MQGRDTTKSVWPRTFAIFVVACAVTVGLVLVARPAPINEPVGDVDEFLHPANGLVSTRWQYIVVHDTRTPSGNAEAFDVYYRQVLDQSAGMGWHFLVRRGSTGGAALIDVGARWRSQKDGYHVFNQYDQEAIGIAVVGSFRRQRPTDEQMKVLGHLVRALQRLCGIPARRVLLHRDLVPGAACPGKQFPAEAFRGSLVTDVDTNH